MESVTSKFTNSRVGTLAVVAVSLALIVLMSVATIADANLAQVNDADTKFHARRALSEGGDAFGIRGAVPAGEVVAVFDRGFVYDNGTDVVIRCTEGWWTTDPANPCAYPRKSQAVAFLLSLSLGWLGVDQFYAGNMALGATKFVFFVPTFGIWALADIVLWARGKKYVYDANGVPIMPWGFNLPANGDPQAIWLAAYL